MPGRAHDHSTSGTFTDGSGNLDYSNNAECGWLIRPTVSGYASLGLSLNTIQLENNEDFIYVFDGENENAPLLATFTGTSYYNAEIRSSNPVMYLKFISNSTVTDGGFSGNFNSYSNYCSSFTSYASKGTINDGSGTSNYLDNQQCEWYLAGGYNQSYKLKFKTFNTESKNDILWIYDGSSTYSPLIGTFSGSALPPVITSSGGNITIRFTTNGSITNQGWSFDYDVFNPNAYCNARTTLTGISSSISDGSGNNLYGNNSNCGWLVKVPNAIAIKVNIKSADLDYYSDFLRFYKGELEEDSLKYSLTGTYSDYNLTVEGNTMEIQFMSNYYGQYQGWDLTYEAVFSGQYVNFQPLAINSTANGGNYSLDILSSTAWTITGLPIWITADKIKGSGNQKVNYTIAPNNLEARELLFLN